MPTKKQLHQNSLSDLNLGMSASDYYGDEHLSPQEAIERRHPPRITEDEGEVIGYYVWDEENKCIKLIPKE